MPVRIFLLTRTIPTIFVGIKKRSEGQDPGSGATDICRRRLETEQEIEL